METLLDMEIIDSIRSLGKLRGKSDFVREIFGLFETRSVLVTQQLSVAAKNQNFIEVRHLAHQLKGTAASIGASKLSRLAATIELITQSDHDCDCVALKQAIEQLMPLRTESLLALNSVLH